METMDFDINHYTIAELFIILSLDSLDSVDVDEIETQTNYYIDSYKKANNPAMVQFFKDMKTRLLKYIQDGYEENTQEENTKQWYQDANVLKQNNKVQSDKTTERKDKINVYNNDHNPMNREQLGVNNTYSVPVAQDTLNPNLKNITSRYINIDSQYRQATGGQESLSTDFTMDLSEPLNNVLTLKLYSIQIPYTWYAVDSVIGNTCFWIVFSPEVASLVSMPSGNYTPDEFVATMNTSKTAFGSSNWSFVTAPISYNKNTGKITLLFPVGMTYTDPTSGIIYLITGETQIVFFDITGYFSTSSCTTQSTLNQTLGWLMGYRLPSVTVNQVNGNVAESLIDLYGPKYLILAIDDFNQNHINNGLITITELSKNIKLPSYYNPSFPVMCLDPFTNNLQTNLQTGTENGDLLMEKLNFSSKRIPQVLATAPRILTQAQIYSINEIMKNNEQNTQWRSRAPSSSDTFALVPIKHGDAIGSVIVELTSSLQENKRVYFGPVNIDRMRIRWYDDKGNVLNMNGADWSITLIAEILYQY
jgi:hypothetical protein